MKHTLYCQCCRLPIAGFDELKSPITVDQFGRYHPDKPVNRIIGGEKGIPTTFVCPNCKRWPFLTTDNENFVVVNGTRDARKEPVRVRVGYKDNGPGDWYTVIQPKAIKKFVCSCGYETDHNHLWGRHKKTCKNQ